MSLQPKLVMRASAGTGKTHALALRFLALLFHGVGPERILATTFTKKAAGEILERVLERLVDAARDKAELADLATQLQGKVSGITTERCETLVCSLARQLDRFQVRTLDSFFAQITRLYAYELGLPPEWRVADEAELAEQSEDAIAKLLLDDDTDETRAQTLELLRELQSNDPANSVTNSLQDTISAGLDMWSEASEEAWDQLRLPPALEQDDLVRISAEYAAHPFPKTKKGADDSRWAKARAADIEAIQAGRWMEVLEKGLTGKIHSGAFDFYGKEFCGDLRDLLRPLLEHASHHVLQVLVDRNLAARLLITRYHEELNQLQRDGGVLGFGDVPRAIAPQHGNAPLSERELEMWFRLDGRVDHLLLDEFQDTAPVQWRILRNIADEIWSEGSGERTFFCVGDEKQSIYGFRHAEPRLLELLHEEAGEHAGELHRSYRSAQELLDGINALFSVVDSNRAIHAVGGEDCGPVREAAELFAASYVQHESARDGLSGAVLLLQPEEPEEGEQKIDNKGLVAKLTVRRVQALVEAAPSGTIAILLRERALIPRLLRDLGELGVNASGEGGNPLTDSRTVTEVLALLHFADHPGDTAAAFHVAKCGLGERFELEHESEAEVRENIALKLRRKLHDQGLGGFLASLEGFAMAQGDAWQLARFRQLLNLAHSFDERGPSRPGEFVRFVRRTRVESSTPALVKVMTIHASKGLGFDTVILPEMDKSMLGRPPRFLVDRPSPQGAIEALSHCPSSTVRAGSPKLRDLWRKHVLRSIRESLCLFYVATTRAKRRLELIVAPVKPPGKKDDPGSTSKLTWAAVARAALAQAEEPGALLIPGAGVLHASPKAACDDWCQGLTDAPPAPPKAAEAMQPGLGLPAASVINPTSASRQKAACLSPAERLASRADSGQQIGTLVHLLMEQVLWIEDFATTDEELRASLASECRDRGLQDTAIDLFRKALELPTVAALLSAKGQSKDRTVWRERRFCLRPTSGPAAGRLIEGAMDRVHIIRSGEHVAGAEIIDYKTDAGDSGRDHSAQIELYRHVLATQLQLDPETIRAGVLHLMDGELEWF